ncbi:carbohydrate sulfotransferase 9-like [Pomacea canaliculata]|uniref:carbohydrate sulfotransferase 9-like n=1 Tax=Pomacea canaliculata TaxID=400727 RepID=UPI000D735215|nr:carbohydrate sulfotransferase 9-like [Pomacea canaliculata]
MDAWLACRLRLRTRACLSLLAGLVAVTCCVQLWLSALGSRTPGVVVKGLSLKSSQQPIDEQSEASSICITKGRRLRMLHYCLPFTNNSLQLRFVDSRVPVISVEHRYLHCPVAKAASTFWVRFMKVLNETGASPFRVALDQRTSVRRNIQTLRDLASREEKLDFLKSATKAVFVRDPYSRMFSAWVDKAFTPNPFYWTVWGAEAIHTFRKRATSKESFCGSDVTFAEVMALAASGMHMRDLHFHPVFTECQPCGFRYDVCRKNGNIRPRPEPSDHLPQRVQQRLLPQQRVPTGLRQRRHRGLGEQPLELAGEHHQVHVH